jgi:hypothetical protein
MRSQRRLFAFGVSMLYCVTIDDVPVSPVTAEAARILLCDLKISVISALETVR